MKRLLLLLPLFMSLSYVVSAQSVPNRDFENWSSPITYVQPDSGWYTSNPNCIALLDTENVTSVAGQAGTGVMMQTMVRAVSAGVNDTQIAYIANTPIIPFPTGTFPNIVLKGGAPFASGIPDHIHGYVKYNTTLTDNDILLVAFKKNGFLVSLDTIWFKGSQPAWTFFNKQISLSTVPDSVVVAAVTSNVYLHNGTIVTSGSNSLQLDELEFTLGTGTQSVPGGTFNHYVTPANTMILPTGWAESGNGFAADGITQATPPQNGTYAIQLKTLPSGCFNCSSPNMPAPMAVTSGYFKQNCNPAGGLAYTATSADTLYGYYKYSPVGGDTGYVTVTVLNSSNIPLAGFPKSFYATTSVSGFTQFAIGWGANTGAATMRIDITSSSVNTPGAGSTLIVDNLRLKSQTVSVQNVNMVSNNISVYPNPANNVLNISFSNPVNGNVNVRIYDLSGKTMLQQNFSASNSNMQVSVAQLPAGMYFYEVTAEGSVSRNKFIKE